MTLALRYAVRSDRGLVRGNNEDSVYAGPRLLAIADGMGGHAAGEVASKIAVAALEGLDEDRPVGDLLAELRRSVEDANQRIAESIANDRELDGMGTTLTALRFVGRQVGLVHVGDSRAYMLRGENLTQITHAHRRGGEPPSAQVCDPARADGRRRRPGRVDPRGTRR